MFSSEKMWQIKKPDDSYLPLNNDSLIKLINKIYGERNNVSLINFKLQLNNLLQKANIKNDELNINLLHNILLKKELERQEIAILSRYEENTGKSLGMVTPTFSFQEETIVIELIKLFFPEYLNHPLPDKVKLSAVIGKECSIEENYYSSVDFRIKFKNQSFHSKEIENKLIKLGACILWTNDNSYSNDAKFNIARYSLYNFLTNLEKEYQLIEDSKKGSYQLRVPLSWLMKELNKKNNFPTDNKSTYCGFKPGFLLENKHVDNVQAPASQNTSNIAAQFDGNEKSLSLARSSFTIFNHFEKQYLENQRNNSTEIQNEYDKKFGLVLLK